LPAVGGVAEVLANLEIPFCVASSGEIEKMETTLGLTGLLPRFAGRMFSASQVPFGKPAPDLFLFTAGSLGVAPERCAVVEDSLPGVQAAVAAGMTAFGYVERSDARSLASAGAIVFDSMT
ncbi:MAG: HAD-IA family hydrolase, partial [Acidobacteria bacterium]|nr:HAD-IA family hydrolase [Acidobacteriota bacterium]